jgi:hypothetical protein
VTGFLSIHSSATIFSEYTTFASPFPIFVDMNCYGMFLRLTLTVPTAFVFFPPNFRNREGEVYQLSINTVCACWRYDSISSITIASLDNIPSVSPWSGFFPV